MKYKILLMRYLNNIIDVTVYEYKTQILFDNNKIL